MAVETTLLSDGRGRLPSEYVFDEVEPAEVEALLDEPYPSNAPYQCLLVRTDAAVVLVDTGLGAAQHPFGGSGGGLPAELARVGVPPEAVDVVVVTHGHLDHIGGNVSEGAPAFPRARYVMSRPTGNSGHPRRSRHDVRRRRRRAREHLPPLAAAGVLDLVDGEQDVAPGIRIVPARGHTPGHLAVEVIGELLYLTDALLHPLQGARPELGHGLDEDPEAATATLRALLGRAAASGTPIACSHVEGVFRVEPAGGAFELAKT